jgi:transcription antitermination factor NusG
LPEELRNEYGILAWSPVIRVQRRLPRRRKTELVVKPLLPSFVFVATHHADEAMELVVNGRVHQMKWFLVNGGPVAIPSVQLGPLHQAQIRGTIRKRPLSLGDQVEILATVMYLAKAQVTKGPLRDDTYEVQIDGQRLKVIFPGFLLRKLMV